MRLGNILDTAGLNKSTLMEALKLGLGAGLFPFVYGIAQSQLLKVSPSFFAQGTPSEYAARGILGVVAGTITARQFGQRSVGDGMMASAVGSIVRDVLAGFTNPAAAAAQASVKAAEMTTGESQVSGINALGRGLAGVGLGGLAGVGLGNQNEALLFGVGTNAGGLAGMFGAATTAIEDRTGLNGATVSIEQPAFAGALM